MYCARAVEPFLGPIQNPIRLPDAPSRRATRGTRKLGRVSDRYRPRREVRLRERNVFPVKGLLLLSRKDFRSRKRVKVCRLYGPGNRRSCRRILAAIVKLHQPFQVRRHGILYVATSVWTVLGNRVPWPARERLPLFYKSLGYFDP